MSGIVGSRFNTRGSGLVGSVGTDGQVFTSSGAGTSHTFEDAAGGGAWTLLSAQTASNDTEIEFTDSHFTSTYDVYKVIISNMIPATDDTSVNLRYSQGGSYNTSGNYEWGNVYSVPNAHSHQGYASHTYHLLSTNYIGTAAGETYNGEVTIYNPLHTNNFVMFEATSVYPQQNGSQSNISIAHGRFKTAYATALDAFKFYQSSGNITSGLFVLYGLAKS
jgi:hypothetical protein